MSSKGDPLHKAGTLKSDTLSKNYYLFPMDQQDKLLILNLN